MIRVNFKNTNANQLGTVSPWKTNHFSGMEIESALSRDWYLNHNIIKLFRLGNGKKYRAEANVLNSLIWICSYMLIFWSLNRSRVAEHFFLMQNACLCFYCCILPKRKMTNRGDMCSFRPFFRSGIHYFLQQGNWFLINDQSRLTFQ